MPIYFCRENSHLWFKISGQVKIFIIFLLKSQGTGPAFDGYGGQSPSSSQFPWEHDGLYSSKQLVIVLQMKKISF